MIQLWVNLLMILLELCNQLTDKVISWQVTSLEKKPSTTSPWVLGSRKQHTWVWWTGPVARACTNLQCSLPEDLKQRWKSKCCRFSAVKLLRVNPFSSVRNWIWRILSTFFWSLNIEFHWKILAQNIEVDLGNTSVEILTQDIEFDKLSYK